ncbi:helix-turn-helix transcriptional regulator [Pelosinus propionicus]|uniref:AraC-type DNA-binding protein n=1 Tax=Pelosinus propionicus DSM 13327 TaxID=1123291 RepID=A0A1I4N8X8_9FIRM|nr:AraC family transcriptional regulator [Pelosinus propionicus]SFM11971.1 AraC-type DNA-binding protein [Pelosinus propionicus DSM 13327]
MNTDEYLTGNAGLAGQLNCSKKDFGNGVIYWLPPQNGNSWLVDIHPAAGLFFTDVYFTLLEPLVREYQMEHPGLWLWSVTGGDLTIIENGKKAHKLKPGIHVLVNQGKPFKIIYGTEPIRYTSVLVFDDCLTRYLKAEAACWKPFQYNTPDVVMVFEQLKYAIRNGIAPPPFMYYESKLGELLSLIVRNMQYPHLWEDYLKKNRNQKHLTYQNRKYIWRVKEEIDKNILQPPSMEQLIALAEMGATKLRQSFKLWYGITIAEYIRQEKLKHALRLLSVDELSISNIAATVGYESASKFALAFKKVYHVTPSEVRKSFLI